MKIKTKKIKIPIYDRVLRIIITNNVKKALSDIGVDIKDSGEYEEASVIETNDGIINLILRPDANINTICHEAFHITTGILSDAGMKLSNKSEEGYAYLIGFIAEKINNELNIKH